MASPTLSCRVPWFPCCPHSESVSISHRNCPEAVKRTQRVPIPSLKSRSTRLLCKNGIARVSVRKETQGNLHEREVLCSVPKKNVPGEAAAELRPQQSGPRKGRFHRLLKQHKAAQWCRHRLSLRYPTDRKAASLRLRALLRPAREARSPGSPRRKLGSV